ncbi:hypothetical protein MBLNU459_g4731t1 [Dothideomycetes sp. NU459]
MTAKSSVRIGVEFTGGLEMLFSNQRKHKITLPEEDDEGNAVTVAFLIKHLCDNLMQSPKKELFILDDSVRPGILVLINDADWELEGEDKYELQTGDEIIFVSTLHGG